MSENEKERVELYMYGMFDIVFRAKINTWCTICWSLREADSGINLKAIYIGNSSNCYFYLFNSEFNGGDFAIPFVLDHAGQV